MNNNFKLIFRKLKLSDFESFKKLFFNCFKRNVSYEFYKSRYFNDKSSFCFGAFDSDKLVANIGMYSQVINNKSKERVFSRHSSMVHQKYRQKGIFSNLSKIVKKRISKNIKTIVMWPNKNNFSNFGIEKKNIISNKFFLYQTFIKKIKSQNTILVETVNLEIDELINLKPLMKSKTNFFLKNYSYFKSRYLTYKKNEYFINKYKFKNFQSFFIIKRNKNGKKNNFVIMDHLGSNYLKSDHLKYLIKNQNKLIFLSKQRYNKSNLKMIYYLECKIGFVKNDKFNSKKNLIKKKEISLGDTDIFISL